MTRGEMKYNLKVIRRGYKEISPLLGLTNFVLIILVGVFVFLLLAYEPADEWHDTNFTLSNFEYRYYRGGAVLYINTTDDRRFVINHNVNEIRHQLKEGQQYQAVYSDDLFHDIIRELYDDECEYINADVMQEHHKKGTSTAPFYGVSSCCRFAYHK